MLWTESEARNKICPQNKREQMCVCSQCMTWRKIPDNWPQGGKGYCGLGGRPVKTWIMMNEIVIDKEPSNP